MLRKIRIVVSLILFLLITGYFIDFAAKLPDQLSALAKWQFLPALLALNVVVVVTWIILTLLFGRIYCSSICPLGVFQDIVAWFRRKKHKKYGYKKPHTGLRYIMLALTLVAFLAGLTAFMGILDPYGAYGRMATNLFKPVYELGNNGLEKMLVRFDNYSLYLVDVSIRSFFSFTVALLTFGIVGFLAFRYGRLYCNTICPVGTLLGVLSRYSLFKIRIDENKCNSCGVCQTKCKASCIDGKEHKVDYSRCVGCFSCLDHCRSKALVLSWKQPERKEDLVTPDSSKRQFVATLAAGALIVPKALAQKSEALVAGQHVYKKKQPIAPPGAGSAERLQKHCTACHLCVARCPSHVLVPAWLEYGASGVMQPRMNFEKGFCNFDCTVCGNICPNGALLPLTKEEKHLTQVGKVVFVAENCIVHTDGTNCGACSEHCPTQAVSMIPYKNELTIPAVNPDICVGCGGCEYVCPVRPYRAIYVEGNAKHQKADPFVESEKKEVDLDDFGF